MKILLINNLYPPYTRGGAERVVETIAHGLHDAGHVVRVVTTVPSFRANIQAFLRGGWIHEMVDGISVYRIATANFFPYWTIGHHRALIRFFWHLFDMMAFETASIVKRIVRLEKPDVVMTHNLMGLGFLIPRALRSLGVKHIHTVHDVQLSVPSGLIFAGRKLPFLIMIFLSWYERFVRFLIGSPSVVISPSQWLLDFYTEREFFSKSKKVVLGNPISSSVIARPIENRPKQSPVLRLLFIGQLEKHKGILFLIETIKQLEIGPPAPIRVLGTLIESLGTGGWKLEIVGSGSLLSQIKNIAHDDPRIHINGAVPHEQLDHFYTEVAALIVPSLVHENAPTVILEAFAHGVPVVASRVGGIPELVQHGETGWLFPPGDGAAFSTILREIFEKKDALLVMRERVQRVIQGRGIREYTRRLLALV